MEHVKVKTKDGRLIELKFSRIQKMIFDKIQSEVKQGKKLPILKWRIR